MKLSSKLAEVCGIHAGDGYLRNDGHRIELDISGNIEERDYYDNHVVPLFSGCFKIKILGRYFYPRNTYGFVIRNRTIIEKMNKLGFPYGKKTLTVQTPQFIFKSKQNTTIFLRGLFDTDGCITFESKYNKRHYYPRIILATCSERLSKDMCHLLEKLKIRYWVQKYTPKNINENIRHIVWIRGNHEVNNWFRQIGSKNPSKLSRYKIWKKYGFCPPNTTYKERKLILNGRLNPFKFYGPVA